jgi:hypothetical protein
MTVTLTLGACLPGQSRPAWDAPASADGMDAHPLAVRFDNDAREHVHVYLVGVGGQRQWLLGRVEPGARATLRIPEAALAERQGFVQLAVLTGERMTPQVARNPRAMLTVAQPASAILSQRWTFAQGQLTPLPLRPKDIISRR